MPPARPVADPCPATDPGHVITRELTVRTGTVRGLADLTPACAAFVAEAAAGGDGLLSVFVPHATAGIVVVEIGAGSDADLLDALDRLLPRDDRWRHRHGSPGHGADHVLPLLAPPSLTVPVVAARLLLGTWQSICLLDPNADNSVRTVQLAFLEG
jgi:secondary thiamine-phosphate synthase enzyme